MSASFDGPRYWGFRYFGGRYFGVAGIIGGGGGNGPSDYDGARYFGPRYFGQRYFAVNGVVVIVVAPDVAHAQELKLFLRNRGGYRIIRRVP